MSKALGRARFSARRRSARSPPRRRARRRQQAALARALSGGCGCGWRGRRSRDRDLPRRGDRGRGGGAAIVPIGPNAHPLHVSPPPRSSLRRPPATPSRAEGVAPPPERAPVVPLVRLRVPRRRPSPHRRSAERDSRPSRGPRMALVLPGPRGPRRQEAAGASLDRGSGGSRTDPDGPSVDRSLPLGLEAALLRDAQRARTSGDAARALALLDRCCRHISARGPRRHGREGPAGARALCARAPDGGARARADRGRRWDECYLAPWCPTPRVVRRRISLTDPAPSADTRTERSAPLEGPGK